MNLTTVENNLKEKGYRVKCFETSSEAVKYLDCEIDGKSVGFGGSVTLGEIRLFETLKTHNNVSWHMRPPKGKTALETIDAANRAEIYFSSANAVAETGEIVNIDGTCNRVSAMLYGHEKVYFVIGSNKLEKDLDSAVFRARNTAAPLNAKRLNKKTPCAVNADKCYNCKSEDRICRALTVLWEAPSNGEYEVIIINEKLGY